MASITTRAISGADMPPGCAGFASLHITVLPQLSLWATSMPVRPCRLLLIELIELLQQPIGMIARDERDVFVDAEFFEQGHKLFWI